MPFFDLDTAALERYLPDREEPADFDAFWEATLTEARQFPLDARFEPYPTRLQTVTTFDVTFSGFGGQPIKGWLQIPNHLPRPLPCVVEFIGYGGGRGWPWEWLTYSAAGYAHLIMDTRGQGSAWQRGDTPDNAPSGQGPQYPGFMTRGIEHPETYYYRRVFTDAVRAIEAARSHPDIDASHIAVTGRSQGGGITLAVAALDPQVSLAMPDVPFLCHYRRATEIVDTAPYNEIAHYLKIHRDRDAVTFQTLSYFDGLNFATRAQAPALFSVGIMDDTTPPSTVYAAYNHYAGPKQIRSWRYNGHEGGGPYQTGEGLAFLEEWREQFSS